MAPRKAAEKARPDAKAKGKAKAEPAAAAKAAEEPPAEPPVDKAVEEPPAKKAKVDEPEATAPETTETAPEEPKEETDAAPIKGPSLKEDIVFQARDTTLNVMTALGGKVLRTMADGGMQYLIAGARANVALKSGRYFYEVKVLEELSLHEPPNKARAPTPKQLVRVGFSVAGSSLLLGDGAGSIYFDSEGFFHMDGKKEGTGKRIVRHQVIGLLLNLDASSPHANTFSVFCNGERISSPKPLPETLQGKPLVPHISYRATTVYVHFGPEPMKPLPFKCHMLAGASVKDAEMMKAVAPKDGKYEVTFPVGFPDQGTFSWLDAFLAKNPDYVELSDRMIIEWATKSGAVKPKSWNISGDKPEFNFGLAFVDDYSIQRALWSMATIVPRNYVVMEVRQNLCKVDRRESLKRFSAPCFKKVARVVMGEPDDTHKQGVRSKLLEAKREKETLAWKQRKQEKVRKQAWEKRQKEVQRIQAERKRKADEARARVEEVKRRRAEEEKKRKEEEDEEKKKKEEEAAAAAVNDDVPMTDAPKADTADEKSGDAEKEAPTSEKVEAKAEDQGEAKAEDKAEGKAEDKGEVKAEDKVEVKADGKAEDKAEGKAVDNAEGKAEDKVEVKADGKAEDKAEGKAEDKAEGKAEDKADGKTEDKAEAKAEDKTEGKAEDKADEKAEEEEADEPMPEVALTPDEEATWFHPPAIPDLAPQILEKTFTQFCIPEKDEGFDNIVFEWQPEPASREYLSKWVLEKKRTSRVDDLSPGEWFKTNLASFQKAVQEYEEKCQAAKAKKEAEPAAKKTDEDEPADPAASIDIAAVEDVNDVGTGDALYQSFEFEDWALVTLRMELYLLLEGFKKDVDDPDRCIVEKYFNYYYQRYFMKPLTPKNYGKDSLKDVFMLVKDTVQMDGETVVLKLEEELDSPAAFVKMAESCRRERERRIDAGDETARVNFLKAALQQPAGTEAGRGGKGSWPRGGGGRYQAAPTKW